MNWRLCLNVSVHLSHKVLILETLILDYLCEEPCLGLKHLNDGTDRWRVPFSGWESSWEWSLFGSWLSTFVFRNVPGTVPECVRICGFKRNSSNLDTAPKMRVSVLLNSWNSFLAPSSISSETCMICSSLILGTEVFRDWSFLGCFSCVSLATAANFHLLLSVAILFEGKMLLSFEDWISFY